MSSSDLSTKLLYYLAEPAVRTLALAALVGTALALARGKDAAVRSAAWTAVLYASVAMPFLVRVAPTLPLPVPVLLRTRAAAASLPVRSCSTEPPQKRSMICLTARAAKCRCGCVAS